MRTAFFFCLYLMNNVFAYFPSAAFRRLLYRCLGVRIGGGSKLSMGCYVMSPRALKIGSDTHINRGVILDADSGIEIGDSVSISHRVAIMSGGHDYRTRNFKYDGKKIVIGDYVWVGVNATILRGVTIGTGAVVCAGAVVTKDVEPYAVVAGVPARQIGTRPADLSYKCREPEPFL